MSGRKRAKREGDQNVRLLFYNYLYFLLLFDYWIIIMRKKIIFSTKPIILEINTPEDTFETGHSARA